MSRSSASSYAHLLRLYPTVWRARYEDEFLALLEDRPPTALHLLDIVLGALDAHVHREIPGTDAQRRRERSWLMNRNGRIRAAALKPPVNPDRRQGILVVHHAKPMARVWVWNRPRFPRLLGRAQPSRLRVGVASDA